MTVKTRVRTTLKKTLLTTGVAGALFLASAAQAAGLGKLTVLSALGQPLSAEIELSTAPGEEAALSARLASADAFRQANIEFHPALMSLRFNVEQRGGRHFIKINSTQPVNEPFVDMLLELSWESGRLVREYTFLLDPVDLHGRQVAEQSAPVAPSAAPAAVAARAAPAARSSGRTASTAPRDAASAPAAPRPARQAASPKSSGDRLTLSTGIPDAPMSAAGPVPKEKTLNDVLERVKELERMVSALERTIAIRNAADAAQAGNATVQPPVIPAQVLPPMPTMKNAPAGEAPGTTAPVDTAAAPAAAAVARPATVQPRPAQAGAASAAPAQPGFVAQVLDHMLYVVGALVVLLLAAAGFFYARRRNADAAGSESLLFSVPGDPTSPAAVQASMDGPLTSIETSADNGNSAFNSSFSPSASHLDINEVDPVAEAGVYIAYGRDEQAEEILREAMRRHPRLVAVRVKLMEIYAARKDAASFDEQAREVHALTRGEGDEWGHVLALGLLVDPANPLYGGSGPARDEPATAAPAGLGDVSADEAALQQEFKDALRAAARAGTAGDSGAVAPSPLYPARTDDATLAFDLNGLDFETPAAADIPEPLQAAPEHAFGRLDLSKHADLDVVEPAPALDPDPHLLDFELQVPELPAAPTAAPALDLSAMDLDMPWASPVESQPAGIKADNAIDNTEGSPVYSQMETKLDLAVAYREIGNEEGARELLDEVIKEGCAEHAAKATDMLAELA